MSAPFCTLGQTYYSDDFADGVDPVYWSGNAEYDPIEEALHFDGAHTLKTFLISLSGNCSTSVKIKKDVIGSKVSSGLFYGGIEWANSGALFGMFYDQYNIYGGGAGKFWHVLNFKGTAGLYKSQMADQGLNASYVYEIERIGTVHNFYINGVFAYADTDTAVANSPRLYHAGSSSTAEFWADDFSASGAGLPNACLGLPPTYHREAVGSTLKISRSRIIREMRTLAQANQYHEIMKGKLT